jgi:hypothetical protein
MTLPILVEPHAGGYRARTGSPFDITADAPTADAAVAAVRRQLDDRMQAGAVVVPYPLSANVTGLPPIPSLADHPLFDDFLKAIAENRAEADAADAAELAAESSRGV